MTLRRALATMVSCALLAMSGERLTAAEPDAHATSEQSARRIEAEGLAVELTVGPAGSGHDLVAGETVAVGFRITDATRGEPVSALRPAAWIHPRAPQSSGTRDECRATIQSFVQGSLRSRPAVDLNTYHVLTLDRDASISVIDPLLGFGGSKLLALVRLDSPGHDWVLSRDGKRLFVSLPLTNHVAVVDTSTWKVIASIPVGAVGLRPGRLRLQADGKYLWVVVDGGTSRDGRGGVTVVDAGALTIAARIDTGSGPHDIALGRDDRFVFVTSRGAGSLTVIDVRALAAVRTVKLAQPVSVAYSAVAEAAYVADAADGAIVVVDARRHEVRERIPVGAGMTSVRFAPGDRFGFVVDPPRDTVHIFDAATNHVVHAVDVPTAPDVVTFSEAFAYVRSTESDQLTLIPLAGLDTTASVVTVAAGQAPLGGATSPADAIVPAPEGGAVLVANTVDRTVYYYQEGMGAPMGSFRTAPREPRAVLVVDRSLRQGPPGLYATRVELPAPGDYDVALLLDSPRIVHCFPLTVKPRPAVARHEPGRTVTIEPVRWAPIVAVEKPATLEFRINDPKTGRPLSGLGVLVMAVAPGQAPVRARAEPRDDGRYEVRVALSHAGLYYVFFEIPSLRIGLNQRSPLVLRAARTGEGPGKGRTTR